jgi:predicted DNA-binding transcriptional regulator AlpA
MQRDFTKRFISPKEFEQIYGIPRGSSANMRWAKKGPKYYRVGRRVMYLVADVEDWIFKNPVLTSDSINN